MSWRAPRTIATPAQSLPQHDLSPAQTPARTTPRSPEHSPARDASVPAHAHLEPLLLPPGITKAASEDNVILECRPHALHQVRRRRVERVAGI